MAERQEYLIKDTWLWQFSSAYVQSPSACILWHILLLKFEEPIAQYLETRNFLWDSSHILCSERSSLIVLVFSQYFMAYVPAEI